MQQSPLEKLVRAEDACARRVPGVGAVRRVHCRRWSDAFHFVMLGVTRLADVSETPAAVGESEVK